MEIIVAPCGRGWCLAFFEGHPGFQMQGRDANEAIAKLIIRYGYMIGVRVDIRL